VSDNIMDAAPSAEPDDCTSAEWDARVELAIAYRLLDRFAMTDLIHTHVSITVPGEPGHFLQLPYGHLFGEARASQMVKCDVDGTSCPMPPGSASAAAVSVSTARSIWAHRAPHV
jgi:ribulose-5-phosphate 4-epimerase/fuculose-1-phosphate aldolase